MEDYNKVIIEILEKSLKDKKYVFNYNSNYNFRKLIDISYEQKISSLVYSTIDKTSMARMDKELLDSWKRKVFKSNIFNIYKNNELKKILKDFYENNIQVIVLKGIVMKEYYKLPEYRTMGDFDILVHQKDFRKIKDLLFSYDFKMKEYNHPIHKEFIRADGVSIEVHWKLINNDTYIANTINFENNVWNNAVELKHQGVIVKMLSKEDFLLHLCIHMAKHLRGCGFGLREVYDVAIYCIKEQNNIDWLSFEERANINGCYVFVNALFYLINSIFDLRIKIKLFNGNNLNNITINILLEDILEYSISNISDRRISLNYRYCYGKNIFRYPLVWSRKLLKEMKNLNIENYSENKELINRRKFLLRKFEL